MTKKAAVTALLLLCALPAVAQQANGTAGPFRVTFFASDLGFSHSEGSGANVSGGYGLALEYQWRPRWSTELSYGSEKRHGGSLVVITEGDGVVLHDHQSFSVRAHPIDLITRYRFGVSGNWKPYLGAGVRYVDNAATPARFFHRRVSAQVTGGVDYQVTPRLSVRFDGKRLLANDTDYDPALKLSVGMGWSF